MKRPSPALAAAFASALLAITLTRAGASSKSQTQSPASLGLPAEKHLRNVRQLTFGGENAEAYFSGDGKRLIFQSKHGEMKCDQIFTMRADGSELSMVSTGKGRTTCSYIFPNNRRILYASTHLASPECPTPVDYSKGYAWAIYPGYDIFTANADGTDTKRLTDVDGYDAEATISVDGKKIVFTSMRSGDLDLYSMDADGRNVRRLTNELGYDGGAFFSRDGKQIVYRSYQPKTPEQIARYKQKLAENLIEPTVFELWMMNADGTNKRQVTRLNVASFAPYLFPDGKRIIFASNLSDPKGRNFDLYAVNVDGSNLERITYEETFDGFPMFSPDGKKLVFASNRNAAVKGDTNIFIADWVE
jgi:Tol biopolymer transport system component